MANKSIKICSEVIHPGEKLSLAMPVPELFSCAALYMPIKVIHGKEPGPTLLLTAAMHGNELNGTEIINRLFNSKTLKKIKGTLIMVPVMNVYGLISRSRFLPSGKELDNLFPGKKNGAHGDRLAHIFVQELFEKADVCIDLQTGALNHSNFPHIYTSLDEIKSRDLATAFAAPVISQGKNAKGSLQSLALKKQKAFLLYEAGEAMRFDSRAIKTGFNGVINVMRKLEMLEESINTGKQKNNVFFAESNTWVRASTSGISHTDIKLGQHVKKGELLSIIRDPFGASEQEKIVAPDEGIIVGFNNLPLIREGEALFQIATFSKVKQAVTHFEKWHDDNHPTS
jgi:predicted deacylase